MNSCDSISDDESVGSCDNHARDTPMDAAEDVFGLNRTGTELVHQRREGEVDSGASLWR